MMTDDGSGYSGTPLAKKLGVKPGALLCPVDAPMDYAALLAPLPENVRFQQRPDGDSDLIHIFSRDRDALAAWLQQIRQTMAPDAVIWVSWPKKTARLETTVDGDVIRALALPLGLVDIEGTSDSFLWCAAVS